MTTLRPANLLRPLLLLAPLVLLVLPLLAGGCVQRTLQVDSNPAGALVYLNGEEAGRTPMRKQFLWYGTYDVQLRKEGYETLSAKEKVWAPWWQWPPFDLFAEAFPLEDNHVARYTMKPVTAQITDPQQVLGRAVQMRQRLKSSEFPQPVKAKRKATTQASTE
jgi:hypothetical protein